MKKVVVVGGGVTGLATAHALAKSSDPIDVHLIEAAARLGGNIHTVRKNAFVLDAGPDSWVATKRHATDLAKEVGLGDDLIGTRPDTRKVYIVWQKQLHPMPEGLVLGIPTAFRPFAESDLLTLDGKLRAGLDLFVPKKLYAGDEDESIASFIARRLGPQIGERIAGPLLGGIFGGDPDQLSVRACAPQLVAAEARYGSLVRAMRAMRREREKSGPIGSASTFLSLERGMSDLIVNVAHRLRGTHVSTQTSVRKLSRLPEGDGRGRWAVETSRETLFADDVVLSVPAHVAAKLTRDVDDEITRILAGVDYVSTATVFLGFRGYDVRHPLDSVGFLVPHAERRPILACTFVSSKWEHRAPAGHALMRVFIGGAEGEHLLGRDDEGLVRIAREQLAELMGITRDPLFTQVFRFDRASPQMHVGHLARMQRLAARLVELPGLHVGGNGYVGTGIPDAVRQGFEMAARIEGKAPEGTASPPDRARTG